MPSPRLGTVGTDYIGPENETQVKLTGIWAEILGIDKKNISIENNFFHLGGHSLKATFMKTRIREVFNVEIPLGQLFLAPLLRQLARLIDLEKERKVTLPAEDANLVRIKKGTGERHLFLVHDGSGGIESYIQFCNSLNGQINIWGIRANGIVALAPRSISVEELARFYIKKIKMVQPGGPYYLAGWSLGGTIVFEILRQMENKNEAIGFVALIDSSPPREEFTGISTNFSARSESRWLMNYLEDNRIREKIGLEEDLTRMWQSIVDYTEKEKGGIDRLKQLVPREMRRVIPDFDRLTSKALVCRLNEIRTFDRAADLYRPEGKVKTPIHLVEAAATPHRENNGWESYCLHPLKLLKIAGNHYSIMEKPAVTALAQQFEKAMAGLRNPASPL